jgi:hypothetical protein
VRTLHDLDVVARLRGDPSGVAGDDPDRLAAAEEMLQNLVADGAGRGGDDDHAVLLVVGGFVGWSNTYVSRCHHDSI